MAKKGRTKQVSRKTYKRIRLLSAAALVACAVMAIVVDASDQSTARSAAAAARPIPLAEFGDTAIPAGQKPAPDRTYVGCLRAEDDGKKFVLTEIGGPDAPKSRNWKTMFVTKKSGKLEVVPAGGLKLRSHVGQTVQMTGKRSENRFSARSIRVVGSTCG